MSGPPVQQYVPPAPYPPPQGPGVKRGISPLAIVAVIIIVILVLGAIGMMVFIAMVDTFDGGPWEDEEGFEDEVLIDEGYHFVYSMTGDWVDEFELNLTITSMEGGPFDIYLMTETQYMNAYANASTGAFSALFEWQNITYVNDTVVVEDPTEMLHLVVDNMDMSYVPGNAVPDGVIRVRLDLDMVFRYDM